MQCTTMLFPSTITEEPPVGLFMFLQVGYCWEKMISTQFPDCRKKLASLGSLNNRSIVLKNSNQNNGENFICGFERTQQTGAKAPFDVIPDNPSLASSLLWWPAIFHSRDLESLCQEKDLTGWPTERTIQRIKNFCVS